MTEEQFQKLEQWVKAMAINAVEDRLNCGSIENSLRESQARRDLRLSLGLQEFGP